MRSAAKILRGALVRRKLKHFGKPWIPDHDPDTHEPHIRNLAIQLRDYFVPFASGVVEKKMAANLEFTYLDNPDMNALADKIELRRRFKRCKDVYIIAVYRGSLVRMHHITSHTKTMATIESQNIHIANLDVQSICNLINYFSLMFLLLHELNHVVQKHLEYLYPSDTGVAPLLMERSDTHHARQSNHAADTERLHCECHADSWAGYMLSALVRSQAQELSKKATLTETAAQIELILAAACGIQVFFLHQEAEWQRPTPQYAKPMLRSGMAITQLMRALEQSSAQNMLAQKSPYLLASNTGIMLGNLIGREYGFPVADYDVHDAYMEAQADILPKIDELGKKLKDIVV